MTMINMYTLTPRHPRNGDDTPERVSGFRDAIDRARTIAEQQVCAVTVRNEADMIEWNVAFRVKQGRNGAYTTVEVTR